MAAHSGSELDNDSDVEFFGCGKVFSDHADSWQGWDKSCSTTGNSLDSSIMPWGAIHQHVGRYAREKDSDIDRILILSSFEIVDYEKSMHKIPPAFVGTCSWIFSHPTFLAFNKAARGLLWIVGPIGHGKSVMAKLFVKKYTTIPLHYFFFDSNTTDGNTFLAVLKIIVKQLLARKPELTVHANASYHKLGAAFSEDLMELMTIFENCVKDARLGDTAILIDGLFECSDFQDEDFLCWITSTLGKAASVLRFIVTSRRFPTSRRNPSPILFRLHLDEDETAHDEICSDVQYYIKTTLNDSPITVQWTRSELTEFVTELTQHSNTFLWVNLFLEELWASKELSFVSACSLLKDTPDSLRAMYQRIFSKVTEGDQKSAKFLLQIIIAADYPLKIEDLNWLHAAYSSDGAAERFDINKRLNSDFQVYLRGLCGSVVPVVDGKASLQHRSVKDFVMEESDSAWYHFTEQEARVLLLQCCFWRLRSIKNNVRQVTPDQKFPPEGALTPPFSSSGKQPDEFFDYAIRHWAILFNQIQKYADEGLVGQIKSLYEDQEVFQRLRESESESCKKVSHIQLHEAVSKALTNQPVSGFGSTTVEIPRLHIDNSASRMYMASYLGHTRIFLAILDTNPLLIDITFDDGWTALCTAISSNQLDIVEAILTRKVDVERPSRGFRPLYHAATNLTSHISRVLLREGANVDALSYHQTTALHHAARNGRVEIVKALLDARANPNLIDGSGRTALHYAAGGGYCDIVDILLENLANPELLDNDSQTPLIVAVEKGRKNVVKSLLRTIPENIFMDCHKLILHAAMRCGNIEILHILVDAKSFELYFKVKDKYSLSAFAYITSTCDIAALKWSSERGADLDELDLQGTTLLQRMSMQDNVVGAKFLIEHGASTQMADSKGRTPLHYAAAGTGHEEMFLLLLKSGGDLEAKDHSGRTAFHDAVVHWRSQTTLRVLKSCGADIESGNLDGDTPLQTAVRMQNSGLVKWLVTDVKVNQDVVSNNGYTLHQLHRESFCQNMDATATGIYDQAEIYRFWCLSQIPCQDDNLLQQFNGTLGEAFLRKSRMITEILNLSGAFERGRDLLLRVSFQQIARLDTTLNIAPLPHSSSALLENHQTIHASQISSAAPRAASSNDPLKNFSKALTGTAEEIDPISGTVAALIPTTNMPQGNDNEGAFIVEQADYFTAGQAAELGAMEKGGRIVPLFEPATRPVPNAMEISQQKVYVHHPCNSREGLDPNQLGSHTTLRGLLAEGAGGQDISDSDRKDIPQTSCSDGDSSKVQVTPSYMRTSSNFVRENSDTDRDISDSSRRLLPSLNEAPPPSFTWSIYSGLLTPPQHDFSPQTQIPIGDSFGLDEYDSDLESLNYTESSEESKNTGPSLVQLGRGSAPEVALALEATRRTIVDLLQVLAIPVGVCAQNIVSCTQDSGPSRKPGPGGEASDQTSSKGKAPVKNSGFGKRKKSWIDDDDGGDHGDGDGDGDACMGDGRDSTCPNQAHCTGCHSSDSSIPGKIRSKHMVTADSGKPLLKQCLYFAHNSDTYQDESCDNPISEVHRLYQHIDRHHRIFLCNRCQEPFKTEPLLKEHGKGGQDCMWKERDDYSTGCTDGQRLALLKKIPKIRNQTIDEGDKWRMKYRILFPNTPKSEIPSPYMEVPNVTMSKMRDTMEVFCNFFKEQIAARICSDLQASWNIDFDVNVQRHTNAIISEYHAMQRARKNIEPPSSPRKKHKPAASTPGPQPTLAGQKKIYSQDQTLAWMGAAPALHPNVAFSFHGDASMMAPETPGLSQSQSGSFNTQASYLPYTPFNSGYPMNSEYPCDRAHLSFPNPAEGDDQDMEILPLLTDEEFAALLQIRFPGVPLPKVFSEGESDLEQLTLANTAGRPGEERTPNSLMVPNTQPPGCCPNWPRCVHWGDSQWSTTSSSVFRRPES